MEDSSTCSSSPPQNRKSKEDPGIPSVSIPCILERLAEPAENKEVVPTDLNHARRTSIRAQQCTTFWHGSALHGLHTHVTRMLQSRTFDLVIGSVIAVNSLAIGFEQTRRLKGKSNDVLDTLEHTFLVIYTLELALRFFVSGKRAFADSWVKFDLVLVALSILTQWILIPIVGKGNMKQLGPVMVMRTARLARLARALRLLYTFRELWMLVRGLMVSARMILYTFVMITIILYMYATVGVELITIPAQTDPSGRSEDYTKLVNKYFSNVTMTMLTLVQFVCMDSIGAIYRDMMIENWVLSFYFMSNILVVAVVLMNIVTAALVNGALEQANQDKEMMRAHEQHKKQKLMKDLYNMFRRLDEDGSGHVDREEILNASGEDRQLLNEFMENRHPLDVFNQLDIEGRGFLDIEEFCEGLYECAISKTPIELKVLDKRMQFMMSKQDLALKEKSSVDESLLLQKLDKRTEKMQQQYNNLWDAVENLRQTVTSTQCETQAGSLSLKSGPSVLDQTRLAMSGPSEQPKAPTPHKTEGVDLDAVPLLISDVMDEALSIPSRDDSSEMCFREQTPLDEREAGSFNTTKPMLDAPEWAQELILEIRQLISCLSAHHRSLLPLVPKRKSQGMRHDKTKPPVSSLVARTGKGRDTCARRPPPVLEPEEHRAAVPPPSMTIAAGGPAWDPLPPTTCELAAEARCKAIPKTVDDTAHTIKQEPEVLCAHPCALPKHVEKTESRVESAYGDVEVEQPQKLMPSMPLPVLGL